MDIGSLLKALMVMTNYDFDSPTAQNSALVDMSFESLASTSNSLNEVLPNESSDMKNCSDKEKQTTGLVPYDFDCGMPYPPPVLADLPSSRDSSNENVQHVVHPHAEATFRVLPIKMVHRLPESERIDLYRFEDYCEGKILDCYHTIGEFNNYNYEKNQEIQYLSYTEKRKQEIIQQSQEKKAAIETAYNRMHQVCAKTERQREKITNVLNPFVHSFSMYFTQPKRIPKVWYDIHNLETIVQQLFTPKLKVRMHFDVKQNELRMSRMPSIDTERKEFIPLPKEYLTVGPGKNGGTVDGASLIMENNHPETAIDVKQQKSATTDQFNNNILEQYTYSTNEEIQQIIIYYVFKFYELKVRDGTRKVFHYTRMLKQKKRSSESKEKEISDLEDRVADAIKELQANTIEMERNRVIPELVGLYIAENSAKDLLPDTKCMTKLIGPTNKRVITAFNPSEKILFKALEGDEKDLITQENSKYMVKMSAHDGERSDIKEPLYWDNNWQWDN